MSEGVEPPGVDAPGGFGLCGAAVGEQILSFQIVVCKNWQLIHNLASLGYTTFFEGGICMKILKNRTSPAGTGQPTLSNMDSQATRVKGKDEHLNESGQNMVAFSESTGHAGTGQAYSPDQSSAELCKRSSAVIDKESGGSVSKLIKRKNPESASRRGSNLTTELSGFSIDGDSLSVRPKSEKQTQPDDKKHLEPVQPEQISHTPLLPGVVFERSSDGVGIVPLVIGSYEDLMISEQEYDVIKKLGRKSYTSNLVGKLVPCSVLKLRNCFAVPVQEDKQIKLIWMMSALCLKKKVRSSDRHDER